MSETTPAGLLDETGRKISRDDAVEPLVQYVQSIPSAPLWRPSARDTCLARYSERG